MKYLLFAFLFLPFGLFAQESDKPFKKSDLIIIETTDTPEAALKKLAYLMQDYGYTIIRYDKELNSFLAQKPEGTWSNYLYQVQAFIREKDGYRIHLFGNYKQVSEDGENLGSASFEEGLLRYTELHFFELLNKIAKAYPGGQVKYGKLL